MVCSRGTLTGAQSGVIGESCLGQQMGRHEGHRGMELSVETVGEGSVIKRRGHESEARDTNGKQDGERQEELHPDGRAP